MGSRHDSQGPTSAASAQPEESRPILRVESLTKVFRSRGGLLGQAQQVVAVDHVGFELGPRETLALVGESGSGKSTVARLIMRLLEPDAGRIEVHGREVTGRQGRDLFEVYRRMQIVFQDPYASLNPRKRVDRLISEPLVIHRLFSADERRERVAELLALVGLRGSDARRYPHEFSGGQQQRICIARALALQPDVLILDEPLSALDVSIQAQIINLLQSLQAELGIAFLFISHDLSVVHHMSDSVAVMYRGRIVEQGSRERVFGDPQHPYTSALLEALPVSHPSQRMDGSRHTAPELDSQVDARGCSYRESCPRATVLCAEETPQLIDHLGDWGHHVACHFPQLGSSGAGVGAGSIPNDGE